MSYSSGAPTQRIEATLTTSAAASWMGQVSHKIYATPSDFPMYKSTALTRSGRSWYEIDYELSDGTEVVYRWIGNGREMPQRAIEVPDA